MYQDELQLMMNIRMSLDVGSIMHKDAPITIPAAPDMTMFFPRDVSAC